MSRTSCRAAARTLAAALAAGLALAAAAPVLAKTTKTMPTLRVMLNPATAPRGSLPDSARARIESLAGAPVTVAAVTITKDGSYYFNQEPVDEAGLVAKLRDAKAAGGEVNLVVSADGEALHGKVVRVIDLAKVEGVTKFAIRVERQEGQ